MSLWDIPVIFVAMVALFLMGVLILSVLGITIFICIVLMSILFGEHFGLILGIFLGTFLFLAILIGVVGDGDE